MNYQGGNHWRWVAYAGLLCLLFIILTPLIGLIGSIGAIDLATSQDGFALLTLLAKSLVLSASAAVIAGMIGGGFAFLVVHIQNKWQTVTSLVLVSPLFVPSYIHALSWSRLFGESAGINPWLITTWVQAFSYFPVVFIVTYYSCRHWSQSCHDAILLHTNEKSAIRFEFGYLKRPLITACLIVFFFSFSDFGVADFFQLRVYATEVFIQITAFYNLPRAVLYSLPVIFVGVILFGMAFRVAKTLPSFSLNIVGPSVSYTGYSKTLSWIVIVIGVCGVILPVLNLLILTGSPGNILKAANTSINDILSSTVVAFSVSAVTVVFALFLSYLHSRKVFKGLAAFRLTFIFMFLLPAALIGLGLIQFWNQAGWVGWIYQSGLILVLGLSLRWLAVAFELFYAGMKSIDKGQEQAVYLSGGNRWSAFTKILLPQQKLLIIFVFLLTFIFSYNEIAMLVLLSPPGYTSMPLRIFSTVHYGSEYLLAALCVVQLLILYVLMGLLFLSGKKLITTQKEQALC